MGGDRQSLVRAVMAGSNPATLTILASVSGLSKVMRRPADDNRDWIMNL